MKIWPLLLLLGGCATPLDVLIEQRTACLAQESCPEELHKEIDRREASLLKRKEIKDAWKQQTWCPRNYVFYCSDFWCQQKQHRKMPEPRNSMTSGCVRRDELSRIFR